MCVDDVKIRAIVCDGFDSMVIGISIFDRDGELCGIAELPKSNIACDCCFVRIGNRAFGTTSDFGKSDVLDLEEIRGCNGGNREEKLRRKNDG